MTVATEAAPVGAMNGLSLSADDASPARIAALRKEVARKEDVLSGVQARIKTTRSGRASVKFQANRFMQNAGRDDKRTSTPVLPTQRSGNMSSLLSKWNKGIEMEVSKTKVDCNADVRGAQKNFDGRDAPKPLPKQAPVVRPASTPIRPAEAAELLVEEEGSVPSWARNQEKKIIRKENARSSTRGVNLGQTKGNILDAQKREFANNSVKDEPRVGGNVAAKLAMWGKAADEEAKSLEKKNVVEEVRREEARKQREREEELEKMRAESDRIEREKREKAEAEEKARKIAAEKKRLEEEKKRAEEAAKRAREEEVRMLRSLPEREPASGRPTEVVDWLTKRIKLLDLLIADADAELAELEKSLLK